MTIFFDSYYENEPNDAVDPALLGAEGTVRVSFALRATVTCDGCAATVPVHAITDRIACPRCGEPKQLKRSWWQRVFSAHAMKCAFFRQRGVQGERFDADRTLHAWYRRRTPRCGRCDTPVPPDALDRVGEVDELRCAHCDSAIPVRPAGELAHLLCKGAVAVVGEAEPEAADPGAAEVVHCPDCGAAVPVDGSARTVPCGYCDARVQVPDELWQRLHPLREAREIYLVADFDEALRWRWLLSEHAAVQRILHGDLELTPALAAALARSPQDAARLRAVQSDLLPEETLARLARDRQCEVRAAVAACERTPVDALVELARDDGANVYEPALGNPSLPLQRVDRLVRDGPYYVHRSVAHRPDLDGLGDDALRNLMTGDSANDILNENPALPAARVLEVVAAHPDGVYRLPWAGLLRHLSTIPAAGRELLVELGDRETKLAIAADAETTNELLHRLADDSELEVAAAAKANPAYRRSFWEKVGL